MDNIFGSYEKKEKPNIKPNYDTNQMFLEAIKTLPFKPRDIELALLADGIREYNDSIDYLKECKERNIMPYSHITFEYNATENRFHKHFYIQDFDNQDSLQHMSQGTRINEINIKARDDYSFQKTIEKIYPVMINNYIPGLMEKGYEICSGAVHMHTKTPAKIIFSNDIKERSFHICKGNELASYLEKFSDEEENTIDEWIQKLHRKFKVA